MNIYTQPESYANVLQILQSTLHEYSSTKHPLYGGVYEFKGPEILGESKSGTFIVLSTDPAFKGRESLPEGFDPYKVHAEQNRHDSMFYPGLRVLSLDGLGEDTSILQSVVQWARTNEFLSRVYDQYGAAVPDHLRESEINALSDYMQIMDDPVIPWENKAKVRKALQKYFQFEKSTGFKRRWLEYFRSDKYPGGSKLKQLWYYLRRKSNIVPLKQLWNSTGSIQVVPMTERDYQKFAAAVKKEHPELTYAVSRLIVRDEGLDKKSGPTMQEGVRRISEDEYAAIREKYFAEKGWECLQGLEPAKFRVRKVYIKSVDTSLVDGLLLRYRLSWAKPYPLKEIMKYGKARVREVEERDFANFVSLAKYNYVPFAIDTEGAARLPKPDYTHVIYPVAFEDKVTAIFNRIVNDAIQNSHDERPMPRHKSALEVEIFRAEELSKSEAQYGQKKALPGHER